MNTVNQTKAATRQPSDKELNHAFTVVQGQLTALRKQLHTATGDERAEIEQRISALLASIGLEHVELEVRIDNTAATEDINAAVGVGAKIALGIDAATTEAAKHVKIDVKSNADEAKPGLWARFKAWVGDNKKKAIAGALTIFAGAAGLWFWLRGKNISTPVSSVSGATDVTVTDPAPVPAETGGASIFSRVGAWLVEAAVTVKGWSISAWNWVKGLFNRTTTATEATIENTVEAVPAGA
jgi:hypothetical protein